MILVRKQPYPPTRYEIADVQGQYPGTSFELKARIPLEKKVHRNVTSVTSKFVHN